MITFETSFNPDDLEKQILKSIQDQIKDKLRRGGVRNVKIKFDRKHNLSIEGPDEEIAKAKKILS